MAKYTLTAKDKADAKKQHKPISSFFSPASGSTPTPKPAPKRPASPAPATPVAKRQKTQEQGSSSRQLKPTVEQSKRFSRVVIEESDDDDEVHPDADVSDDETADDESDSDDAAAVDEDDDDDDDDDDDAVAADDNDIEEEVEAAIAYDEGTAQDEQPEEEPLPGSAGARFDSLIEDNVALLYKHARKMMLTQKMREWLESTTPEEITREVIHGVPQAIKEHFRDGKSHAYADYERLAGLERQRARAFETSMVIYLGIGLTTDGSEDVSLYVGQSCNPAARMRCHERKSGHPNKRWYNILGDIKPDFAVLWYCTTKYNQAFVHFIEALFMYALGTQGGSPISTSGLWASLLDDIAVAERLRGNNSCPLQQPTIYGDTVVSDEIVLKRRTKRHGSLLRTLGAKKSSTDVRTAYEKHLDTLARKAAKETDEARRLRKAYEKDPNSADGQLYRERRDYKQNKENERKASDKAAHDADPNSVGGQKYKAVRESSKSHSKKVTKLGKAAIARGDEKDPWAIRYRARQELNRQAKQKRKAKKLGL